MVEPGDVLSGRYALSELIGRGGMAEVFRARDERLGRDVAVKVLATHLLRDAGAARQLQREARATAALRHPGLVAVYDIGSDGDVHYIVLELVDGPTLAAVLQDRGPLDIDLAVAVTMGVAEAVQAAHAQGIVHRDLKPSNVLFDADERVRVTDFGIAHAAAGTADATATAMLAGSIPYLSPEQAHGSDPTPAVDVYALGCLLFELLTGHAPFERDTAAAVIAAHLQQEPPAPSSLRPDVPADLDAIVARSLAKEPERRYADAGALADALGRTSGELPAAGAVARTVMLPPAATTTVLVDGDRPPAGSRRGWAGGAVVLALAAAGVTAWLAGWVGGEGSPGDPVTLPPAAQATETPTPTPSPSPTPTPSPSPSPSPRPSPSPAPAAEPATPEEAAAEVRERLEQARRDFEIDDDDAEDLDDRLAKVIEVYRDGKAQDVRKELRELRKRVDEYAREDRIEERLREDLHRGLDRLEATL